MGKKTSLAIVTLMLLLIFGLLSSSLFVEGSGKYGYSYKTLAISDRGISPFDNQSSHQHRHLLGTDKLGRDTLAGIGNGIKVSFYLSIIGTLIGLLIGLLMSFLSTFHLFTKVKLKPIYYWIGVLGFWYCLYLILLVIGNASIDYTYLTLVISFIAIGTYFISSRRNWLMSLDEIIVKVIEVWRTLPALLILIILSSLLDNITYLSLGCLIGLLIWPSFTRILRGEFMKLSELPFVKSSIASGASVWTIYWRHLIPSALSPLVAHVCFTMVGIILLEATLSFLSIGIPYDQVSLGGMISASTDNLSYWWMAIFPGLTLVIILISLNRIGTSFLRNEE